MTKFKKKFMGILLSTMLVATSITGVYAENLPVETKAISVNGQEVTIPEDSIEVLGGTTYVLPQAVATLFSKDEAKLNLVTIPCVKSNNQNYYNLREIANLYGYEIGFDATQNQILLFNVDKLLENVEFSIFNKAMLLGQDYIKDGGSYQTDGVFGLEATVGKDEEAIKFGFTGDMTSLSNAVKSDSVINVKLNLEDVLKLLLTQAPVPEENATETTATTETNEEMQKIKEAIDLLKNTKIEMRTDLEKGIIAFKSNELAKVLDGQPDTWYALDLNSLFTVAGTENLYSEMLKMYGSNQSIDFKDIVKSIVTSVPLDSTVNAETRLLLANTYSELLSDSSFVDQYGKYTSEYVVEESGIKMTMTFVMPHTGDKITGLDLVFKFELTEGDTPSEVMNFTISQDKDLNTKSVLTVDIPEILNVKFNYDAKVTKTDKQPAGAALGVENVIMITDELIGTTAAVVPAVPAA